MDSKEDIENHQHNLLYFNQMIERNEHKKGRKKALKKIPKSFSSQKVDLSDYLVAPEGYEGIVYTIYFLVIPYIVGLIFLFLFVAGGDFANFKLMEMKASAFLIVWMIGYEIVATLLLVGIFISFLRYDDKPNIRRRR